MPDPPTSTTPRWPGLRAGRARMRSSWAVRKLRRHQRNAMLRGTETTLVDLAHGRSGRDAPGRAPGGDRPRDHPPRARGRRGAIDLAGSAGPGHADRALLGPATTARPGPSTPVRRSGRAEFGVPLISTPAARRAGLRRVGRHGASRPSTPCSRRPRDGPRRLQAALGARLASTARFSTAGPVGRGFPEAAADESGRPRADDGRRGLLPLAGHSFQDNARKRTSCALQDGARLRGATEARPAGGRSLARERLFAGPSDCPSHRAAGPEATAPPRPSSATGTPGNRCNCQFRSHPGRCTRWLSVARSWRGLNLPS